MLKLNASPLGSEASEAFRLPVPVVHSSTEMAILGLPTTGALLAGAAEPPPQQDCKGIASATAVISMALEDVASCKLSFSLTFINIRMAIFQYSIAFIFLLQSHNLCVQS